VALAKLAALLRLSWTASPLSTLTHELEVEARADAALIKGLVRRTTEDIIEIGNALIRQKNALPGAFHSWIEAEFGWQERMAQRAALHVHREQVREVGPVTSDGSQHACSH
jgi:hypothetical protein